MDEHEAAGIIFYGLDANRAGRKRYLRVLLLLHSVELELGNSILSYSRPLIRLP